VEAAVADEVADEIVIEEEQVDNNGKRSRTTRKFTFWNFVDKIDASNSYCKCGCMDDDGISRKKYSAPTTGHVSRHVEKIHPELFTLFNNVKNTRGNFNELIERIDRLNDGALQKATKRRRLSDKFFSKSLKLQPAVTSDLRLLLWAIGNGVSRNAINDVLFDQYLRSLGTQPATNRHTLQNQYLPVLDDLVRAGFKDELKSLHSVAIASDGWRDRTRRDWINIVLAFIVDSEQGPKKWNIRNIEPDLVFLPSSATGDTIAYLINNVLDSIVLLHFMARRTSSEVYSSCQLIA
jgi:hypothetical protein